MKFKPTSSIEDIDSINNNLISSWNSLNKSLRDQDQIVALFNASQEAYGIALKLKDSSSAVKETITSIESLIGIKFETSDVQCVVEGTSIFHSEAVQKFVNWIKELFTRIKVWVRTLIEKLRTRFQWMSTARMSSYLKKENMTDDRLSKLTSGIIGKSIIDAVSKVAADSKTRRSMIRTVIESNTDKLDELKQSMWFSSSSGMTVLNGKMFDVEDGELVTYSDREYKLFSNSSEESAPISMSDIIALEDAVKILSDSLIEFEVEADTRSNALAKKIESLQDKNEMAVVKDKLMAVKDAIVKNSNVVATICSKINVVMSLIKQKVSGGLPKEGEYTKIYVGNLSYATTEKDLIEAFSKYVTIYKAEIVRNKFNGNSKGFGYVYIAKGEESKLEGKSINVKGRDVTIGSYESTSDLDILNKLPDDLKNALDAYAKDNGINVNDTHFKLPKLNVSDVIIELNVGERRGINQHVYAIINASDGKYVEAAKVGEEIDSNRMDPAVELPAGYVVKEIVTQGLLEKGKSKAFMKALVQ